MPALAAPAPAPHDCSPALLSGRRCTERTSASAGGKLRVTTTVADAVHAVITRGSLVLPMSFRTLKLPLAASPPVPSPLRTDATAARTLLGIESSFENTRSSLPASFFGGQDREMREPDQQGVGLKHELAFRCARRRLRGPQARPPQRSEIARALGRALRRAAPRRPITTPYGRSGEGSRGEEEDVLKEKKMREQSVPA